MAIETPESRPTVEPIDLEGLSGRLPKKCDDGNCKERRIHWHRRDDEGGEWLHPWFSSDDRFTEAAAALEAAEGLVVAARRVQFDAAVGHLANATQVQLAAALDRFTTEGNPDA
jgi:hypothetical protein